MNVTRSITIGADDSTLGSNSTSSSPPLLISPKDARIRLCIGERKLWELTICNAIPSHKIGRSVRYSPDELHAWIAIGCPTDPGSADRVRKEMRS